MFKSRYVKRCVQCRAVKGLSMFPGSNGRKSSVCKVCTGRESNDRRMLRWSIRRLAALRHAEGKLEMRAANIARQLNEVRAKIAEAEEDIEARSPKQKIVA